MAQNTLSQKTNRLIAYNKFILRFCYSVPNVMNRWSMQLSDRLKYIDKGRSIQDFTAEQILMVADEINATPRKRLGYQTPEELFDAQLDIIYSSTT